MRPPSGPASRPCAGRRTGRAHGGGVRRAPRRDRGRAEPHPGLPLRAAGRRLLCFPEYRRYRLRLAHAAIALLDEPGVATISGTSFGAFGEGYLRFSYAASLGALEEAVGRIRAWLERQGNSRSGFTGA